MNDCDRGIYKLGNAKQSIALNILLRLKFLADCGLEISSRWLSRAFLQLLRHGINSADGRALCRITRYQIPCRFRMHAQPSFNSRHNWVIKLKESYFRVSTFWLFFFFNEVSVRYTLKTKVLLCECTLENQSNCSEGITAGSIQAGFKSQSYLCSYLLQSQGRRAIKFYENTSNLNVSIHAVAYQCWNW